MKKIETRGIAVFIIVSVCTALAGFLYSGCASAKPPEPVAVSGAVCPPDVKFCPVPIPEAAPPAGGFGRLVDPARGKVLVYDANGSDPRVIDDYEIPAGVWLVREGGK